MVITKKMAWLNCYFFVVTKNGEFPSMSNILNNVHVRCTTKLLSKYT